MGLVSMHPKVGYMLKVLLLFIIILTKKMVLKILYLC